jgi:hypothetical protein
MSEKVAGANRVVRAGEDDKFVAIAARPARNVGRGADISDDVCRSVDHGTCAIVGSER